MGSKGVYTFPKSINLKMDIIVWLEFELAYYDIQHVSSILIGCPIQLALCHIKAKSFVNYYDIQHVNPYITGTPLFDNMLRKTRENCNMLIIS